MGIVKKQAYKNTMVSYGGMVIGYINVVLLFPYIFTTAQYGFYNLITSISVLYSTIASIGVPSILAKYFPFYRTDDKRHKGFMHWAAGVAMIGFAITTLLYIVFKPQIIAQYADRKSLLPQYYYYMIPMAFFVIVFNYLEMTGRIVYQTVYSNFLQNILVRVLTTGMLLLMAAKKIDFGEFVFLYIGINGLISLLLLLSIAASGTFSYRLTDFRFKEIKKREMLNFGLFTLVSGSVYVLLQKVDTLMLSSMVNDSVTGVYSWYFNIAVVVGVPTQALSRTTYAIVADSWKSNNLENIAGVYYKTSIVQMAVGCLLFVGIIVNRENLYAIARNKEYTDPKYFNLFFVIGLGFLVDITGGLNTYIITTSHKYRLVTLLSSLSVVFCIGLNYILIPKYHGLGAAISYLAAITALNFCTWFYLKYRFNMQPFTVKHLLVIVISLASFASTYYLGRMHNVFLDILIRSGITGASYAVLTYLFRISEDVNDKVDSTLKKLLGFIK